MPPGNLAELYERSGRRGRLFLLAYVFVALIGMLLGLLALITAYGYVTYLAAWVSPRSFWQFLHTPGEQLGWFTKFLLVVGMLVVAMLMYLFKEHSQTRYALLEIAFAMAISWRSLGAFSSDPFANLLALMGALYLMNRGVTNLIQSEEKTRVRRMASTTAQELTS